jgi:hypothetical protein
MTRGDAACVIKIWAVCRGQQLSIRAREAGAGRSTPSDRYKEGKKREKDERMQRRQLSSGE